MRVFAGFDIGSTYTKLALVGTDGSIIKTDSFLTPVNQRAFFDDFKSEYFSSDQILLSSSCGYGRNNISTNFTLSELVALAKGLYYVSPEVNTVLDIGGQDSKAIHCKQGKLQRFVLNDKCAAGCGLLLQNALHILNYEFENIQISGAPIEPLSSVCAVFAQTEIIRRISQGGSVQALIESVLQSICKQSVVLLKKIGVVEPVALTGGLAQIPSITNLMEPFINVEIIIPPFCTHLSAIGCAYHAMENMEKNSNG